MWMTVLIAGGLFVALLAMLWLNLDDAERRRAEEAERAVAGTAGTAGEGQCLLCEAPLMPRRTSEEVVGELERRIAEDLAEIDALRGGREGALHLGAGRGRA